MIKRLFRGIVKKPNKNGAMVNLVYVAVIGTTVGIIIFLFAGIFGWNQINNFRMYLRERLLNNKIIFDIILLLTITFAGFVLTFSRFRDDKKMRQMSEEPKFVMKVVNNKRYAIYNRRENTTYESISFAPLIIVNYSVSNKGDKNNSWITSGKKLIVASVSIPDFRIQPQQSNKKRGFIFDISGFVDFTSHFNNPVLSMGFITKIDDNKEALVNVVPALGVEMTFLREHYYIDSTFRICFWDFQQKKLTPLVEPRKNMVAFINMKCLHRSDTGVFNDDLIEEIEKLVKESIEDERSSTHMELN